MTERLAAIRKSRKEIRLLVLTAVDGAQPQRTRYGDTLRLSSDAIATFFYAASNWHFNSCLFHCRQVRIDAGISARKCVAGVAASGNCARGIALAWLPRLARNFCRCISGEHYHC